MDIFLEHYPISTSKIYKYIVSMLDTYTFKMFKKSSVALAM